MTASCSTLGGPLVLYMYFNIFIAVWEYSSVMCIWLTCPGMPRWMNDTRKIYSCRYNPSSPSQDRCSHMSTSVSQFLNVHILQNIRIKLKQYFCFLPFFLDFNCRRFCVNDIGLRVPAQNLRDFSMFHASSSCKNCPSAARNQISRPIFYL